MGLTLAMMWFRDKWDWSCPECRRVLKYLSRNKTSWRMSFGEWHCYLD